MQYLSKFTLVVFVLTATILSSCKKNAVEPEVVLKPGIPPVVTGPRIIYVSGNLGSDASVNPFSTATPYKTIQKASDITLPGDEVQIMNGTYEPDPLKTDQNDFILKVKRSGSAAGGYITYKNFPGHNPVIYSYGQHWDAVQIVANYIILDGLELKGVNNNTPTGSFLDRAKAAEAADRAGADNNLQLSEFSTNGIQVGEKLILPVHHVTVQNCKVHDFPGAGIGAFFGDYITIQGNTIYNNDWFSSFGGSGISVIFGTNSDSNTGYKTKILNNIVYNNFTQVPYKYSSSGKLSDGNGIIIDINYNTTSAPDYNGRTLVENNVVFRNGAGGVHVFKARHVDLFNNTSYNNETVLDYGNIDAYFTSDVKFRNNIAYAKTGGIAFTIVGTIDNITADYNLNYNGTVKSDGTTTSTHNIIADPKFMDIAGSNFNLQTTSPAINAGMPTSLSGSLKDIVSNQRLQGSNIDCGAYEIR